MATQLIENNVVQARTGRALKWRALSLVMRTVGRASDGIDLGYRRGFDSGEMLDYVYEDRARGRFAVGRLIDRLYLNAVGWCGIRNRRELLKNVVRARIEEDGRLGRETRIVDVASGPGRYLLEVLRETNASHVSVLCRDLAATGLHRGRQLRDEAGLAESVRYEHGDAFDPASIATIQPRPNLVIVSGLYELFLDRAMIQRSLAALYEHAEPGATFVVTTQVSHPQLDMIANVLPNRDGLPWIMECRPASLTEEWLREAGLEVIGTDTEKLGLFAVTVASKPD